ncbi:hypothetical protein THICB1_130040 [Thiomonas arsenitoxydans]|uniref:Transposase n=1 Tax=Thiomonas arsenitoxydans (strain DSM 22701 / CIP 110005 / 3As) TaxID=426114 RepID=A0ABM9T3H3_THIA3|nr:hypothetical protein ACO7_110029 [Thiomonas arsenitoxydans]CQR29950.1 hypothetical protein THICB1_130040 [Thiomonas arsenitoxydans]
MKLDAKQDVMTWFSSQTKIGRDWRRPQTQTLKPSLRQGSEHSTIATRLNRFGGSHAKQKIEGFVKTLGRTGGSGHHRRSRHHGLSVQLCRNSAAG